ncbi:MAG TPA: fluoride efflux transporter CrcB [Plantibacter sp.]|uniref:fluoride efflux transporter CrcB n=1 Tax=Plantibacter sp. TaxID=1871045 RepID=UPI002C690EB2|nr:fluoride efflux transporter CrcB [Plantibacter sp.]
MTPVLFLMIAVAGGVGAAARFVLDGVIRARLGGRYPWGTTIINVSGSLLLGFVTALALSGVVDDSWRLVLGGGFLGGYTTFSTASIETVRLLHEGRSRAGLANAFGMLVASVLAAILGYWLGALVG